MPAPTSDTRPMPSSLVTVDGADLGRAPTRSASRAASRSVLATVNEMSVIPLAPVFCTIMSTLMPRSASSRNSRAATPGRSGTPATVTFASDVSSVTAVTTACSMVGSSSTIQVPGSQVKLERTCSGTWWRRANSTERSMSTRPPVAAISIISSKETLRESAGLRRDARVGREDAGDVGVDLADVGLEGRGQGDRGDVGPAAPQRRDVAVGRDALETRDDRDEPVVERLADAVGPHLEDLGAGVVGVGDDPGLGPGERRALHAAVGQRHAQQRHRDPLARGEQHVELARRTRRRDLGRPGGGGRRCACPSPRRRRRPRRRTSRVRATWSATARIRSASPTDVPPYFWTTSATRQAYRDRIRSPLGDRLVSLPMATSKRERQKAARREKIGAPRARDAPAPHAAPRRHHRRDRRGRRSPTGGAALLGRVDPDHDHDLVDDLDGPADDHHDGQPGRQGGPDGGQRQGRVAPAAPRRPPRASTRSSGPGAGDHRSPRPSRYYAHVTTTVGDFVIKLLPAKALHTVNNFVFLADHKFFNCVIFHRVIPGFVIQGGDPTGTGTGGPGYSLPDELPTPASPQYPLYSVAMANAGAEHRRQPVLHRDRHPGRVAGGRATRSSARSSRASRRSRPSTPTARR